MLYPADSDPKFAGRGYDQGYLTSVPGGRGEMFYSAIADPRTIASDEARKDVISGTFMLDGIGELGAPSGANQSNLVNEPVLLVSGEQDALYCGHDLTTHPTSGLSFLAINQWIGR
ncbi:MAG: hypothetical protein HKP61_15420 [Dactylosporangium sp.]|nr:hypothetical protein [Dactylosporangium sp.]NNJ62297.1 hypothetical protein [Dactylosporangium sp.]